MKTSNQTFVSKLQSARFNLYLAAIVGLGLLALGTACFVAPAHADSRGDQDNKEQEEGKGIVEEAQVAELDQLLADFHGALSYGGNITAMMNLWTEDSSIALNGVPHVGKAAVQSFFTNNGYFHNNWVSLAPEYKTRITVHGNTAEATTQCVAIDLTVTPNVVKSVIEVNATMIRHGDKWFFTSMDNTSPAPL